MTGEDTALTSRDAPPPDPTALLSVRNLRVTVPGGAAAVEDVSFDVRPGEIVGVVGESGCGKTLTMLSVMRLLPAGTRIASGEIWLGDHELVGLPERELRQLRGSRAAMIYQDPMTSLNPLMRVGDQIAEGLQAHGWSRRAARAKAIEALGEVGIPRPARAARAFPHEFSGGMRQRVMIASALVLDPELLIADEPTTALDPTIQQQVIDLVVDLQRDRGMAVVWVTHDLGIVARLVARMLVMYAGRVAEVGPTREVFRDPTHPYTAGLLGALPSPGSHRDDLVQMPGSPPQPGRRPPGCPFQPRCPQAIDRCATELPPLLERGERQRAACWVPPEEWSG
jgi:oligopeptide/dipeptide ABC transporter ATP-binding protein